MPKLSSQNNLQWICRRCEKQHPEVKAEHSTESLKTCGFCGTENWCFPVASGRPVKGGKKAPKEPEMLKEVIDEARVANSEAIATHILKPETGTNTTDTLVYDEIAPAETAPEAESTEENEALEEAVDEALEAVIEEAAKIEKEPEETPVEAEPETVIQGKVLNTGILMTPNGAGTEEAKNAEIAELEAELEALKG